MNEAPYALPECAFALRAVQFASTENLPLAAARNFAAAQSTATHLVFLDVDCIPAPEFLKHYVDAFQTRDQLWSGEVRYLQQAYPGFGADMDLWSTADPIRGGLSALPYELFWSLNFGCSRSVYDQIGGFDESYGGYGAEDTDFSFKARLQAVPLALCKAMAYHQHHASYHPPLNHLEDIIENANVFYQKWQHWPMEGWLQQFERMGLISRASGNQIRILRRPDPEETAACLKV